MPIISRFVAPMEPFRTSAWWLLIFIICYLFVSFALWTGAFWSAFFLALISFLALTLSWVAWLIYAIRAAWKEREAQSNVFLLVAAPFAAVTLAAAIPPLTFNPLQVMLNYVWFESQRPLFATIIDRSETGPPIVGEPSKQSYRGVSFVVAQRSPTLIAFEFRNTGSINQYLVPEGVIAYLAHEAECEPFANGYYNCDFEMGSYPFETRFPD